MKKKQIPALLKKHKEILKSVVVSDNADNKDLIYQLIERQLGLKLKSKKAWDRITGWDEDQGWSEAWVYDLGLETEQVLYIRKLARSSASQMNMQFEYFVREDMLTCINW